MYICQQGTISTSFNCCGHCYHFLLQSIRTFKNLKENIHRDLRSSGIGSLLPKFRDNLSVPSSRLKQWTAWPPGCPETSVTNYQSTMSKIPEERRSNLHGGGSLKSRKIFLVLIVRKVLIYLRYLYFYVHLIVQEIFTCLHVSIPVYDAR